MPYVERSIQIDAPTQKVFDFIANQPERMADWWSTFELQERVSPPPTDVGSVSRYVYNMLGVKIRGEHEVINMDAGRYLQVKTISGIDSTFDFSFKPQNAGTNLTIKIDYSLPGSILGQLMNQLLIEEKNIQSLEDGLANLKAILETDS